MVFTGEPRLERQHGPRGVAAIALVGPQQLLFGRAGPAGTGEGETGMSDIYVATRAKSDD